MSIVTKTNSTGYVSKMKVMPWVLLILTLIHVPSAFAAKPWPRFNEPHRNKLFESTDSVKVKIIYAEIRGFNFSQFRASFNAHLQKYKGNYAWSEWEAVMEAELIEGWDENSPDELIGGYKYEPNYKLKVNLVLPRFHFPQNMPYRWRNRYAGFLREIYRHEMNHLKNRHYAINKTNQEFNKIKELISPAQVQGFHNNAWNIFVNVLNGDMEELEETLDRRDHQIIKDLYPEFNPILWSPNVKKIRLLDNKKGGVKPVKINWVKKNP